MSVSSTVSRPRTKKPRKGKKPKKKYLGRIYIGRNESGKQIFEHVGWFAKKKERERLAPFRRDFAVGAWTFRAPSSKIG